MKILYKLQQNSHFLKIKEELPFQQIILISIKPKICRLPNRIMNFKQIYYKLIPKKKTFMKKLKIFVNTLKIFKIVLYNKEIAQLIIIQTF